MEDVRRLHPVPEGRRKYLHMQVSSYETAGGPLGAAPRAVPSIDGDVVEFRFNV
jgi:hypothetical protein